MLRELEVGFEQHGPAHDRDDDGRLKAQRLAGEERPFAAGKLIAATASLSGWLSRNGRE